MAPRKTPLGYHALTIEAFAELQPQQAEQLVGQLVRRELGHRHAPGFDFEEHPPEYVAGPDMRVTIHDAPRITRENFKAEHGVEALTFDELEAPVVYSIKSGEGWKDDALAEARAKSDWAVDPLSRGGRLVLVTTRTNHAPSAKRKDGHSQTQPESVRRQIADAYEARLKQSGAAAAGLYDRVRVVDAHELRAFLLATGYTISDDLRTTLAIPPTRLLTLDGWLKDHQADRRPAPRRFVWDAARKSFKQSLEAVISTAADEPDQRTLWLVAPPGVGKTRLVVESLREMGDVEQRCFVAPSPETMLRALEDGVLDSYKDAIVVVDDCSVEQVRPVFRHFVQSDARSRLIVITPLAQQALSAQAPALQRFDLLPLEPASAAALVCAETGWTASDPRVADVVRVTEGYPWFGILVGKELAQNSRAPAPSSFRHAVDLALSPWAEKDFAEQVRKRAAGLFAIMLLESEIIDDLPADEQSELARLLAFESWVALRDTVEKCAIRGLLRPGDGGVFRYVTPSIIEIDIAERFLAPPPGPGSPPPLGPRLRSKSLRARLDRLLARLEKLGFPTSQLAVLAMGTVDALEGAPRSLAALEEVSSSQLLFAARHQAQRVASALRSIIEATPPDQLQAARGSRRALVSALEVVAERRGTFEDVEAALFLLARAENEAFANNASNLWMGLFDVVVNTTYLTYAQRRPCLLARLAAAVPGDRLLALGALGRLTGARGLKRMGSELDGPFPQATGNEVSHAVTDAWGLLIERLGDLDAGVASAAAAVVAKNMRQAIRAQLVPAFADALVGAAPRISGHERGTIREALELASNHDRRHVEGTASAIALDELQQAFAPNEFHERLHARVGSWGPVRSRLDESVDQALAQEGLESPELLLQELTWLSSPEAARRIPFLHALGVVDVQERLLAPLLERASLAPELLSSYLYGRQRAGARTTVDACIGRLRADGLYDAAAWVIWRTGYTPERLAWLVEDLGEKRISERTLSTFVVGGWFAEVPEASLPAFVRALETAESDTATRVALECLEPRPEASLVPLLLRAFQRASLLDVSAHGHFAYEWKRAGSRLIEAGHAGEVARSTVRAVMLTQVGIPRDEVAELLAECAVADGAATWAAVRQGFEKGDAGADALVHALRDGGGARSLPHADVAEWVGVNRRRAELIARLVPLHGREFPGLARELIERFGPTSSVADVLLAELETTPRAVSSLAKFADAVVERLSGWLQASQGPVRVFLERALDQVRTSRNLYAAHEEAERRRRSGT